MVGYIYLIENENKKSFFRKIFFNQINNNGISIGIYINNKNDEKKQIKFWKKIIKKIKKRKINSVVLEDRIQTNINCLKEELINNDISVITGEVVYEEKLNEIIEHIFKYLKSIKIEEINLGIIINTLSYSRLKFIKEIATKVKGISVLSDYTDKFEKISTEIMENTGLSLKVTNNYRNGLKNCTLVINFDFNLESINNVIYNNCILINLRDKIKKVRNGFSGILINDINLEIKEDYFKGLNLKNFRNLALIQSIKGETNKIYEIVGIRGIIDTKEFETFKIVKRKK